MNSFMTIKTNRNNIEPMLRQIARMMVILCRLIAMRTLQRTQSRQSAFFNSLPDCLTGLMAGRMPNLISLNCIEYRHFALFRFAPFALIRFEVSLAFWGLSLLSALYFAARFTRCLTSIFVAFVFVKFGKWLDLFASGASFRYDCLRHCFSPNQKSLCLEPNSPPIGLSGSLYSTSKSQIINQKLNLF